jgi:hypothetical protein
MGGPLGASATFPTIGADRSLTTVFFSFAPLPMSDSSAPCDRLAQLFLCYPTSEHTRPAPPLGFPPGALPGIGGGGGPPAPRPMGGMGGGGGGGAGMVSREFGDSLAWARWSVEEIQALDRLALVLYGLDG